LFEKITEVVAKRKGEVTAARMLMERGAQELRAERPYEAIRCLGRSLSRLHKHESRHDAVRALLICGSAYERAGLFWAARGSCLAAAALAVGDFWTYSEVTPLQAACYSRLKWLELRLGRVPQALAWHDIDRVVTRTLIAKGDAEPGADNDDFNFDAILGILFLRTDLWYLPRLSRLPEGLERMGLFTSPVALLYALGHEDLVPSEFVPEKSDGGKLKEFFTRWRDQPAAKELPDQPAFYDGLKVELTSIVLGCRVVVQCDNSSPCVELAESVVAAVESFAATGHSERVMAREPALTIEVGKPELAAEPFEFDVQDRAGRPHVLISCRDFSPHRLSPEAQRAIKSRILDLIAEIAGRVFFFGDSDRVLEKLIKAELAIDRSVNFTSSFGTVGNVLDDSSKTSLAAWTHDGDHDYPLKRTAAWDEADRRARAERPAAEGKPDLQPGQGPPPPDLFHPERTRHTEMQTVSLIREALWERAGWVGTAFMGEPGTSKPPVLALVFKDPSAASQILTHLCTEVGPEDQDDALRITIIRHFDRHNPHAYRVVMGSNPKSAHSPSTNKMVLLVARVHTMTPSTSSNLDQFLDSYAKAGSYYFTCAMLTSDGQGFIPAPKPPIVKKHLHVREAWQIGLNDMDGAGLLEDDEPIIPPSETEAPVIQLLRWKRQQG
jgi:hypothetical protein